MHAPRGYVLLAALTAVLGAQGCGNGTSDGTPSETRSCLDEPADATCTMSLYGTDATFAEVFDKTLQPKCGSNPACHSGNNAQRGLRFDDEAEAYDLLMQDALGGTPRVIPGDTQCGEVIYRLEVGGVEGMPPGSPLSDEELCSIRHWIANGAPR